MADEAKIKVRVDTQGAQQDLQQLDRSFERTASSVSKKATKTSIGLGGIVKGVGLVAGVAAGAIAGAASFAKVNPIGSGLSAIRNYASALSGGAGIEQHAQGSIGRADMLARAFSPLGTEEGTRQAREVFDQFNNVMRPLEQAQGNIKASLAGDAYKDQAMAQLDAIKIILEKLADAIISAIGL